MPDASLVDASSAFINADPILGSVVVVLMVVTAWVARQWLAALKSVDAEKDARLADAKEYAASGEAMRNAMQSNTSAIQSILEVVRDRGRP